MKLVGIPAKGLKIGKDGKPEKSDRKPRDVSEAIRQRKSKRQRCVTKAQAKGFNSIRLK